MFPAERTDVVGELAPSHMMTFRNAVRETEWAVPARPIPPTRSSSHRAIRHRSRPAGRSRPRGADTRRTFGEFCPPAPPWIGQPCSPTRTRVGGFRHVRRSDQQSTTLSVSFIGYPRRAARAARGACQSCSCSIRIRMSVSRFSAPTSARRIKTGRTRMPNSGSPKSAR